MNPFRPALPITEKSGDEHPWSRYIKDAYFNKIKYAHNSIRNPEYPHKYKKDKIKLKVPLDGNKIKFTVVGDRLTKEFIYCANLVKGLYTYRKEFFDPPTIQGTTTVEWPTILNDLKARYKGLAYCLTSSVAVIKNDEFLGGEPELKEFVESRYTYHLTLDYRQQAIDAFAKFITSSGRACAYMNIAIDSEPIGTLIFMLYDDILPYTSSNFLRLCKETRGGYSGTPIHRIVKDGWVQGGGYGLKETDLDCENFIIPHDRRGVLGMANSGMNEECSTQFFVLLQPQPWMAKKFVAFGQLIEGKETLDKIEAVPCWYESPNSEIIIYKAGIFNMDCQDIMINRGTNDYIEKHTEDLNEIADIFYAELLENVFLTAQMRELERLKALEGEGAEHEEEDANAIRETKRFNRRKEDIEKQLRTSKASEGRPVTPSKEANRPSSASKENNDFDVESYDPEYEETDYQHVSLQEEQSMVVRPRKPFYIPLTDVKYPEEKDSQFDLKRFLQGDYCLESDLKEPAKKFIPKKEHLEFPSNLLYIDSDNETAEEDVDSGDDWETKKYLKSNVDRMSFAGSVVKRIGKARAKQNILEDAQKSELISDDLLRRIRMFSMDLSKCRDDKKVSISVPKSQDLGQRAKIKRRQTGFVRPDDLAKVRVFQKYDVKDVDDEDDDDYDEDDKSERRRRVRISQHHTGKPSGQVRRRPTAFVHRPSQTYDDDSDDDDDDDETKSNKGGFETRQSVLVRLFDEVAGDDEPPTLKDYRPASEGRPKSYLMFSSNYRIKSENEVDTREKYLRPSMAADNNSYQHVLNLQHGKKMARKISSDYVKTIDQIEHRLENSIRSVEYAKTRPAITVHEYQAKNRMYFESQKKIKPVVSRGIRLPGDSPLYSEEDVKKNHRKSRSHSRSHSVAK